MGEEWTSIITSKRIIAVVVLFLAILGIGGQVFSNGGAQAASEVLRIGPTKYDRLKSIIDPPSYHGKEKVGYFTEDWPGDKGSLNSVKNYGQYMTAVAPFAYRVEKDGKLTGNISEETLLAAKAKNLQVLALVHNFNSKGFDRQLVSTILNDRRARTNLANNIYNVLEQKGLAGVNIDLENISGQDRDEFNAFLKDLKAKLRPEGYLLTISVPAKERESLSNAWSGGFDYKFIGATADRVMLMTYDEHWFGGTAGPVASVPWAERVVKYAVSQIPKDKLLLGIGIYGYDWSNDGKTRTVPSNKAIALAGRYGAKIQWDNQAQVPYFNYWPSAQKHTVWFESTQSAALKGNLVKQYDLRGVAVWRLGFEDASFWKTISNKLDN